jgi:hypothetical protein
MSENGQKFRSIPPESQWRKFIIPLILWISHRLTFDSSENSKGKCKIE